MGGRHGHRRPFLLAFVVACLSSSLIVSNTSCYCSAFTLVMMGRRRGKVGDKKLTSQKQSSPIKSLNGGKGQEITGVSLPAEGTVKGWQFGNDQKMACVNVEGTYYALQADCPRCAFDLFKGTVVTDEAFAASEMPRLACPTCSTTYGLKTGTHGPALKRTGLSGFVGGLAKTATVDSSSKDAKAYTITCDPSDGRVFCRER
eukprot:CAMPEP_0198302820 /NCGR_PEP_ID=MMETSP1449-20131203/56564_1 /TAXON_ID=420275 /ORGANISM="Attheya septentrionalis, Strain CCMP2084" /LENGTH=201 /DNA_ID=CAMNT_0044005289 /DNA_START=42 /DNA_END=647 /DNA_ORIENTATION=-